MEHANTNREIQDLIPAGGGWPLSESDWNFIPVIQAAGTAASPSDYLFAAAMLEYARDLRTLRTPAALSAAIAGRADVDPQRLAPFLYPDDHGFPHRAWLDLSDDEQQSLVDIFCRPPVLVGAAGQDSTRALPAHAAGPSGLVFGVQKFTWLHDHRRVLATIGARCRREFGSPQRGRQHRHGQTSHTWAAALHRLAVCRLRVAGGVEAARDYQDQVRATGGRTKFGSIDATRRDVAQRAQKLFPWLPAGEIPIHAIGPNDAEPCALNIPEICQVSGRRIIARHG